ncbi:hypothetical protein B8U92_00180 [Streptococcus agalactiae]|nr:hypothetical protein B8U92_00180 [Streptococcus agalactiae]KAF1245054.1 hypothetical protein B8V62_08470 [Streptococcus agalactiae]
MLGHWVISLLSIGLEWSWSIWIGINLIMMILLSYVLTKTEPISNYQESSSKLKKWLFAISAFSVLFCWALLVKTFFPIRQNQEGLIADMNQVNHYFRVVLLLTICLIAPI